MAYFVYMLECQDGSYYTGSTINVEKRFRIHLSGKGASYTRSHKPRRIIFKHELADKSSALKLEISIKKLTRHQKEDFIADHQIDNACYTPLT